MSFTTQLPKPVLGTQELLDAISKLPLPSEKIFIDTQDVESYKDYYNKMIDRVVAEQEKVVLTKRIVDSLSKQQILKILDNLEYVTNFLETIENGN